MNKKSIFSLVLSCSLVCQFMLPKLQVSSKDLEQSQIEYTQSRTINLNQEVYMPDDNLRKVLNTKYLHQEENAPITKRQLQYLKGTLYLGNSGITDLTGIEHCKGVTGLYLSYNKISDISPLMELKRLKRLNITNQEINGGYAESLNSITEVNNIVVDLSGNYVTPTRSSQYNYDPINNKITFENTYPGEHVSYSFNKRISYGSDYTTYFSGNVNYNVTSN